MVELCQRVATTWMAISPQKWKGTKQDTGSLFLRVSENENENVVVFGVVFKLEKQIKFDGDDDDDEDLVNVLLSSSLGWNIFRLSIFANRQLSGL